jgi:ribosome maturation factor RimP
LSKGGRFAQYWQTSERRETDGQAEMAKVEEKLVSLIERAVEGMDYELVDVERGPAGLLRVTLDAPGVDRGIGLDDCERVSHQLTHLFAVEDVAYERLEVSSPGLDRRLSKPREFERFTGHEIQVQLVTPLDGKRRLRGRLLGISGASGAESVRLELQEDGGPAQRTGRERPSKTKAKRAVVQAPPRVVEFALANIERARLVPVVNFGGAAKGAGAASGSAGR